MRNIVVLSALLWPALSFGQAHDLGPGGQITPRGSEPIATSGNGILWVDKNAGNALTYTAPSGVRFSLSLTGAKGSIPAHTGLAWSTLAVGANGLCLKADSAQSTGLIWGTCGTGGLTLLQDAYNNSTNPVRVIEDNSRGSVILRANGNSDNPLTIENSVGTAVASVSASGVMSSATARHDQVTAFGVSSGLTLMSNIPNSGSNSALNLNTSIGLTGSTKLASFLNNSVEKSYILNDGSYVGPAIGTSSGSLHALPSGTGAVLTTDATQIVTGKTFFSPTIDSPTFSGVLGGLITLNAQRFESFDATIAASGVQDVGTITPPVSANSLILFCDYGWYYNDGADRMAAMGYAVTYRKVAGTWTKVGIDGVNTGHTSNSYATQAHGPGASAESAGNIKVRLVMGNSTSTTVRASCREMWL